MTSRRIYNADRKYLPTISELIDRLSIVQLKEVFITEHKEEYAKEIKDIVHDIDMLMNWEKPTGEMISIYCCFWTDESTHFIMKPNIDKVKVMVILD